MCLTNWGTQHDGEDPPNETDAFEASNIAGAEDGDYPRWLQADMDSWIPRELLLKYGENATSRLNGRYWDIYEGAAEALANDLRALGYTVAPSELEYWC